MNLRVILSAIFGGLLTVYGLWLISVGDYFWGIILLLIGVFNGIRMIQLIRIENLKKE